MEKENSMDLITEFEFELPRGYLDENGELHKKGVMRMATAFLQNMYQTINSMEDLTETCVCPHCGEKFEKPVNFTRAE